MAEEDSESHDPHAEAVNVSPFDSGGDVWKSAGDANLDADDVGAVDEVVVPAESARCDYVFMGEGDLCMSDVQALLAYVAESGPTVGNSLDEASRASRVLLVGEVDEATMATLVQRSVQIERLGGPQ